MQVLATCNISPKISLPGVYATKIHAEKKNRKLIVLYDIACLLEKHLKVCIVMHECTGYIDCIHPQNHGRMDLLEETTLGIPLFHVYGHGALCQVLTFVYHHV